MWRKFAQARIKVRERKEKKRGGEEEEEKKGGKKKKKTRGRHTTINLAVLL